MQFQLQFNNKDSVCIWSYDPNVAKESLGRLIATTDLPISFGESSFFENHVQKYHIIHNFKKLVE